MKDARSSRGMAAPAPMLTLNWRASGWAAMVAANMQVRDNHLWGVTVS
jgi:hypothetical protein